MNQEETLLEFFQNVNEYIPIFHAFADPERLLILLKLFYAGSRGKNVTELSGKTRLSRPAISHHLKVLKAARIVDSRKEGTQVYYTFNSEQKISKLEELIASLRSHLQAMQNLKGALNEDNVDEIIARARSFLR